MRRSWESPLGFAKIGKKAQLGGGCVCVGVWGGGRRKV